MRSPSYSIFVAKLISIKFGTGIRAYNILARTGLAQYTHV
jgi:hypothetical protein